MRWERVDNLIASLPADTHYTTTIDENDYLTVRFGTGARGSVPPAGSQVTARYRTGLGSQGNVGADTLTTFVSAVPEVKTITNAFPTRPSRMNDVTAAGSSVRQSAAIITENTVTAATIATAESRWSARIQSFSSIGGRTYPTRRSAINNGAMRIDLVEGDVTVQAVDAIVNAANSSLLGGGGVDGAIHRNGGPAILEECRALRATRYPDGLPAGDAVATTAGKLPARWVIHTVGPIWRAGEGEERAATLRSCYTRSLAVADELGATTLAFPLISSGAFGWPFDDAVLQALTALAEAESRVEEARLVLFGDATLAAAERVRGA